MPRGNPATGVYIFRGHPTIVFLTVCALNRKPLLANQKVQDNLCAAWNDADAWMVGSYVIMPDHIHCSAVLRMSTFLLNTGSHIGNGDFIITSMMTRRDSSHAGSTIVFGGTKVT